MQTIHAGNMKKSALRTARDILKKFAKTGVGVHIWLLQVSKFDSTLKF